MDSKNKILLLNLDIDLPNQTLFHSNIVTLTIPHLKCIQMNSAIHNDCLNEYKLWLYVEYLNVKKSILIFNLTCYYLPEYGSRQR